MLQQAQVSSLKTELCMINIILFPIVKKTRADSETKASSLLCPPLLLYLPLCVPTSRIYTFRRNQLSVIFKPLLDKIFNFAAPLEKIKCFYRSIVLLHQIPKLRRIRARELHFIVSSSVWRKYVQVVRTVTFIICGQWSHISQNIFVRSIYGVGVEAH